jgi:NADP-dependent 3-hydroxy acid dehydrogenase YdfG
MRDTGMRKNPARTRTALRPLAATDSADAIAFVVTAPAHAHVAELVVVPVEHEQG